MGFDALSWQVIWLHKKDIDMIGRDRRIQVVDSIINGLNYKNKKKKLGLCLIVWPRLLQIQWRGERLSEYGGAFFFFFFFFGD